MVTVTRGFKEVPQPPIKEEVFIITLNKAEATMLQRILGNIGGSGPIASVRDNIRSGLWDQGVTYDHSDYEKYTGRPGMMLTGAIPPEAMP